VMATSHGDGAGGGAGGAFVAMSAAIAEVAIPAAKTNDKATLIITCPFCCPCLYSGVSSNTDYEANSRSAPCAACNFTNSSI